MKRLPILAVLLVSVPTLYAQSETGFAPGPGFRPTTPNGPAYACTPESVGADGRCASTAIPGGIPAAQTPQFLLISFDDCMTQETEGYVRSMLTPDLRNPDGRPVPSTYFLSLEGCPGGGGESEGAVVKKRYLAGDEIAVHTRTHSTSTKTTYEQWRAELSYVKGYLEWLGLGADAGVGFRAPFLATNPAMYQALDDLGFLYDSSVYESPFWSPVSSGTQNFIWPFTYDSWSTTSPPQTCASWTANNTCPKTAHAGLWQVPLYYYVGGEASNATYYGVMDIGDPAYSGYSQVILGNALKNIYQAHLNARLNGDRAPLSLYYHAHNFGHTQRAAAYHDFIASSLARGDVWAVTMQGLIEWMKAPVPNSQMKAWYASYCTRHVCPAPTTSTAAESVTARAPASSTLQVFPSPARGPVTVEATTGAPGATLTVHDLLGREVRRTVLETSGTVQQALDLGNAAPGRYFVRLTDGARTTTRSLVVER